MDTSGGQHSYQDIRRQMIRQIEETSMNAWPALHTMHYDGWIIRFADGVTKRSNSVNLIYDSRLDIISKIEYCESLYRSRNLPVCFKLTEIAQPPGIDDILEARGYNQHFNISVQLMNIKEVGAEIDRNAVVTENTDEIWLDDYSMMNEITSSDRSGLKKIIDQIILPKCLLTFKLHETSVGCGLGVVEGKYIGLFDIVIDKHYRNQGFGKLMIENILKWGKSKGAEMAYLQVLIENAPANRLYETIGFKEKYRYWYRSKI